MGFVVGSRQPAGDPMVANWRDLHCPTLQAASEDAPIVKLWGEDALLNWPGAM